MLVGTLKCTLYRGSLGTSMDFDMLIGATGSLMCPVGRERIPFGRWEPNSQSLSNTGSY